jgi:hypothetical protein
MAKLSKAEEDELAALNASLSSDEQKELDELNAGLTAESPRGRETPGATSTALSQLGDHEEVRLAPTSINDRIAEEEAGDLEAVARQGADQALTAYGRASNVMTLGAADKIRSTYAKGAPMSKEDRAEREARNPMSAMAGTGVGYLASGGLGAGKILDTGARGVVSGLAPWLAKHAAGRVAGAGAAGAMSGAAQGALLEGDAKGGAIAGGVVGAGAQAGGEVAKWMTGALKKNKVIKRFADAKADGRMAQAEREAAAGELTKDPEGQFKAAAKARDRIWARDEALAAEEGAAYGAATQPHLSKPANLMPVEESLEQASTANRLSNGKPIDAGFEARIAGLREQLPLEATNADLVALRRSLQEAAAFDSPTPTDAQLEARKLYLALRDGIRGSSDEIAAADDAFTSAQRARARRNDLLLGNEEGPRTVQLPDEAALEAKPLRQAARANDERNAAVKLSRLSDDSVEGARAKPQLEELAAQDPEFAAALKELEGRKAWMATRFGAPAMPTNLNRAIDPIQRWILQNSTALGARAGLPLAGAGEAAGAAAAGSAGSMAPVMLRLGFPVGKKEKRR